MPNLSAIATPDHFKNVDFTSLHFTFNSNSLHINKSYRYFSYRSQHFLNKIDVSSYHYKLSPKYMFGKENQDARRAALLGQRSYLVPQDKVVVHKSTSFVPDSPERNAPCGGSQSRLVSGIEARLSSRGGSLSQKLAKFVGAKDAQSVTSTTTRTGTEIGTEKDSAMHIGGRGARICNVARINFNRSSAGTSSAVGRRTEPPSAGGAMISKTSVSSKGAPTNITRSGSAPNVSIARQTQQHQSALSKALYKEQNSTSRNSKLLKKMSGHGAAASLFLSSASGLAETGTALNKRQPCLDNGTTDFEAESFYDGDKKAGAEEKYDDDDDDDDDKFAASNISNWKSTERAAERRQRQQEQLKEQEYQQQYQQKAKQQYRQQGSSAIFQDGVRGVQQPQSGKSLPSTSLTSQNCYEQYEQVSSIPTGKLSEKARSIKQQQQQQELQQELHVLPHHKLQMEVGRHYEDQQARKVTWNYPAAADSVTDGVISAAAPSSSLSLNDSHFARRDAANDANASRTSALIDACSINTSTMGTILNSSPLITDSIDGAGQGEKCASASAEGRRAVGGLQAMLQRRGKALVPVNVPVAGATAAAVASRRSLLVPACSSDSTNFLTADGDGDGEAVTRLRDSNDDGRNREVDSVNIPMASISSSTHCASTTSSLSAAPASSALTMVPDPEVHSAAAAGGKKKQQKKMDSSQQVSDNYVRKNLKSKGTSRKLNRGPTRVSMAKQRWQNRCASGGGSGGGDGGGWRCSYGKGYGGNKGGSKGGSDGGVGGSSRYHDKPRGLGTWGLDPLELSLDAIVDANVDAAVLVDEREGEGEGQMEEDDDEDLVVLDQDQDKDQGEDGDEDLECEAMEIFPPTTATTTAKAVAKAGESGKPPTSSRSTITATANSAAMVAARSQRSTSSSDQEFSRSTTTRTITRASTSSSSRRDGPEAARKLTKAEQRAERRAAEQKMALDMMQKAPLCPGHHMPSKLLIVKKSGPNKVRRLVGLIGWLIGW